MVCTKKGAGKVEEGRGHRSKKKLVEVVGPRRTRPRSPIEEEGGRGCWSEKKQVEVTPVGDEEGWGRRPKEMEVRAGLQR